ELSPSDAVTELRELDFDPNALQPIMEQFKLAGSAPETGQPTATTTVAARPAGTKPHSQEALSAKIQEWRATKPKTLVKREAPWSSARWWPPKVQARLRATPEKDVPRAFDVWEQVVRFLEQGRAGGWGIEILGVDLGDSGQLIPGDPAQGTGALRVISERVEATTPDQRPTIRVYVPLALLREMSREQDPVSLREVVEDVAHELLQQAPASAFKAGTAPPRADPNDPDSPAPHWWVSAAEIQAFSPMEAFGERLAPRQAADLHRAVAAGDVAYLRRLIDRYYELVDLTPAERSLRGRADWPAYDAAVKNSYALTRAAVGALRTLHVSLNDRPDLVDSITQEDRDWMASTLKLWDSAEVAVVGAGAAGLAVADVLSKAGKTVHIYDKDGLFGGFIRWGILPLDDAKHGRLKDRQIGATWRLEMTEEEKRSILTDLLKRPNVRFFGGITIGEGGVSLEELRARYGKVVLATGAPVPNRLAVRATNDGEDVELEKLTGVWSGIEVSAWANGDPEILNKKGSFGWRSDEPGPRRVVIFGLGNVAGDMAWNAANAPQIDWQVAGAEDIVIAGRGGVEALQMTASQLESLAEWGFELFIDTSNLPLPYEQYKDQVLRAIQARPATVRDAVNTLFRMAKPVDRSRETPSASTGKKAVTILLYTEPAQIQGLGGFVRSVTLRRNRPRVVDGTIQFDATTGRAELEFSKQETVETTRVVAAIRQHPEPIPGTLADSQQFLVTERSIAGEEPSTLTLSHFQVQDITRQPMSNVYAVGWVVAGTPGKGLLGPISVLGRQLGKLLLDQWDVEGQPTPPTLPQPPSARPVEPVPVSGAVGPNADGVVPAPAGAAAVGTALAAQMSSTIGAPLPSVSKPLVSADTAARPVSAQELAAIAQRHPLRPIAEGPLAHPDTSAGGVTAAQPRGEQETPHLAYVGPSEQDAKSFRGNTLVAVVVEPPKILSGQPVQYSPAAEALGVAIMAVADGETRLPPPPVRRVEEEIDPRIPVIRPQPVEEQVGGFISAYQQATRGAQGT
ncbi:MAG: FAD-dependent oxidoreductase, partial [Candidatus Omnitrophica bacterium]|nr:FAD-dependent oxidoreductase [Candidatus Omnitrophota bacterium]